MRCAAVPLCEPPGLQTGEGGCDRVFIYHLPTHHKGRSNVPGRLTNAIVPKVKVTLSFYMKSIVR